MLAQQLQVRRAVKAGEHVMLLSQLDVGKSKSLRRIRDHWAAVQECVKVCVDPRLQSTRLAYIELPLRRRDLVYAVLLVE